MREALVDIGSVLGFVSLVAHHIRILWIFLDYCCIYKRWEIGYYKEEKKKENAIRGYIYRDSGFFGTFLGLFFSFGA
jgi:hypothetical protein